MVRRIILVIVATACIALVPGGAFAADGPNPTASCNGVFSYLDARHQGRDDVSHIVKEIADDAGISVGAFFSDSARQQPCG